MQNTLTLNLPVSFSRHLVIKKIASLKIFWILSIVSLISVLGFYIFQVNQVTSEGYLIQRYQRQVTELGEENKILEINSVQINSLVNLQNKAQELGFEKANRVNYFQVLESQIVKE